MAATSTYLTVSAALKAQLTTALATSGENSEPVFVDHAADLNQMATSYVIIGDVVDGLHIIPTMKAGRKAREEMYRIEIRIGCHRQDRDAARTAAFALMGEVEDTLANDPKLGLTALPTLRVGVDVEWAMNHSYDERYQGWRVDILYKPLVQVRLA